MRKNVDTHVRQDIAEGVRWLMGNRPVRTLALVIVTFNITWAAPWSVLVLWALQRVGIDAAGFGLLTTASALGGLLATVAYGWLERRVPLALLMRLALGCEVVFHLGMALTTSPWTAYPLMFFFGAYAFVWGTLANAVRQRAVPTEFQGRVGSVYMICVMGGMLIGSLLGGLIARWGGVVRPGGSPSSARGSPCCWCGGSSGISPTRTRRLARSSTKSSGQPTEQARPGTGLGPRQPGPQSAALRNVEVGLGLGSRGDGPIERPDLQAVADGQVDQSGQRGGSTGYDWRLHSGRTSPECLDFPVRVARASPGV